MHPYQRSPQSGAGNCTCGYAEHARIHPHSYREAASWPGQCVCGYTAGDPVHQPGGAR